MAHLLQKGNKKGSRPSCEGSASSSGIDIKLARPLVYDEGQRGQEGDSEYFPITRFIRTYSFNAAVFLPAL